VSESKTHHKLTNNNPTLEQNLQTAKLSLIRFERSQTVQCGDTQPSLLFQAVALPSEGKGHQFESCQVLTIDIAVFA
jgi:hypothetical protein